MIGGSLAAMAAGKALAQWPITMHQGTL
jgi:hypothetical protein